MLFFSKSTGGFYDSSIHGENIPSDVVKISETEYHTLLDGQARGLLIRADDSGCPVLVEPPPPTQAQIQAGITAAIQAHLDSASKASGYDDIRSAVTYADEPAVPKFQAEGQAFRRWRSMVWACCYGLLAEVEAGKRQPMTADEVIAQLPPLDIAA